MAKEKTPCEYTQDENGKYVCPFQDTYGGYEDGMCRVCCGCGVDEDPYPEEDFERDFEEKVDA